MAPQTSYEANQDSDHPGFLAGIIEKPDDDAPRLVYADWIGGSNGPLRSEFIRDQVVAARRPTAGGPVSEVAALLRLGRDA